MAEAGGLEAVGLERSTPAPRPASEAVEGPGDRSAAHAAAPPDETGRPASWLFFGLGLALQTFLWFLLFLAIVIAVAVGGELTEFRYVGF
jgi:hypothetical protein